MTKKGGIQQLQAELNSDEDLEKFLERNGLLVIDIYSEWCGPCLGMVSSLRKIKLEIGGDNLHLAVAKSDYITPFHRFQRKSEPTWMFVVNGKSTNIAFGTDVPALTKIILNELNLIHETDRVFYEIGELQPEELQMKRILEDAKAKADAIEEEQRLKKRHEYLTHVTDIILDNLKDAAVTIFGPQVNREMFKKINEPADSLKIQCKDRRMINITPENFEIINFDCPNPIHPDIEKQFYEKEVMICFWKLPENGDHTLLFQYELELSKSSEQTDEVTGEVITTPPILTPLEIQIQVEVDEDEADELQEKIPSPNEFESEEHEDINGAEEIPNNQQDLLDISNFENVTEETTDKDTQLHIEQPSELTESLPAETQKLKKKVSVMKTIKIPPVWVPANQRTHAALIYVLFRNQTTGFLPPDPIPEPPHVIMAFDSYKKRDIIPFTEKHKESVPLYGFFTSDIIAETKLIANSLEKYSVAQKNS